MTYISDALAYSPDVYYRLGDSSGSLTDATGNGHSSTVTGTITYSVAGAIAGDGDTAITTPALNGTGSITTAYGSWMNRSTFTAYIFFKTSDTGVNQMFTRWGSSTANQVWGIDLQSSNGIRGYARVAGASRIITTTVTGLRDGNWHMAAVTYDGSEVRLVVDGVVVGTPVSISGALNQPAAEGIRLGFRTGEANGDSFNGSLDEAYFGPVLTTLQVAGLYATATGAATPAAGSGSLSLSGSGGAVAATTGTASLELFGEKMSDYDLAVRNDAAWVYNRSQSLVEPLEDFSGNDRDLLVPASSPTLITGPHGDANTAHRWPSSLSGDYYAITSATIGSTANAATLECWFKAPATSSNALPLVSFSPAYGSSAVTGIAVLYYVNGELQCRFGDATNTATLAAIVIPPTGQWNHVVAQFTSTGVKIRLNKVDVATQSHGFLLDATCKFQIHGAGGDGRTWDIGGSADIAKAAGYLTTLSDADTDEHYDLMDVPQAVTGSGSLALSGSAAPEVEIAGLGSLSLSATGYSDSAPVPVTGAGSLSLSGAGTAVFSVEGSGSLELFAEAEATPLYLTDTSNALQGRSRGGLATFAAVEPATYTPAAKVDKAVPLPVPTMVNGRPT